MTVTTDTCSHCHQPMTVYRHNGKVSTLHVNRADFQTGGAHVAWSLRTITL